MADRHEWKGLKFKKKTCKKDYTIRRKVARFKIEISSFVIFAKLEAQDNAWSSKFSEIDG